MKKPITPKSAQELLRMGKKITGQDGAARLCVTSQQAVKELNNPQERRDAARHAGKGLAYIYVHCGIDRAQLEAEGILQDSDSFDCDERVLFVDTLDLAVVEKIAGKTWEEAQTERAEIKG